MADEVLKNDQNFVRVLGAVTDDSNQYVTMLRVDPTTKRLLVSATGIGAGSVTSVSVVTANGISGSVATATTTPAITLTLGAITPTTVNGNTITTGTGTLTLSTFTLTVANTASISGTNTGDQTSVSGNAGTATALQNARTIGGVSFNGTANITVATATGGFTVTGGDLALAANNLTLTGSIAATGSRVTKGWFTDLEVTNAPTLGGVAIPSISSTNILTNKTLIATTNVVEEITAITDSATPTPTGGSLRNAFDVTALGQAATFAAPSGSPANWNRLVIRIKDNGTARALTWNSIYRASSDLALPTTTILSKTLYCGFIYNSTATKWDLVAYINNF